LISSHIHCPAVEVEVLPANRIALQKRDPTSRRMAIRCPGPRLEQPGSEQPDLYDLTSNPIDLHPVPDPYPIPAHQNKPTAEGQDEILEHDRQPRCHAALNSRNMI